MKKIQLLAALSAVLIGFGACSGNKLPSLSGNEAREAFASSKNICMKGRKTAIHVSSDIEADGAIVGRIKEKGFFDSRYVYSVEGKEQFYIKHIWNDDIPQFKNTEYETGATEGYFDMDKNCIGYMQEVFRSEKKIGDYLFFDAQGKPKSYYIPRNDWTLHGAVIYDMDGNEAGHIDVRRRGWFLMRYTISIFLNEGAAAELSEMDRIAMLQKTELFIDNARKGVFYNVKS